MEFLNSLLLAFIPLFVAIDIIGVVPIFIGLTDGIEHHAKRKLITEACLAALALSLVFLTGGDMIFRFLGITANDFRVGGGIVLLVLSVKDLVFPAEEDRKPGATIGIVPLGIPLIIGPAAMTTIMILVNSYGYIVTIVSILANLLLVWLIFRNSNIVLKLIGEGGTKAFAKVAALFMAAIAVMMIRVGMSGMLSTHQ